jgi:hypothetical protein
MWVAWRWSARDDERAGAFIRGWRLPEVATRAAKQLGNGGAAKVSQNDAQRGIGRVHVAREGSFPPPEARRGARAGREMTTTEISGSCAPSMRRRRICELGHGDGD